MIKTAIFGKVGGLVLVLILLLIGLGQITDLVNERQGQRSFAIQSVGKSLAGSQTLLGPLLQMSCTEEWTVRVNKTTTTTERRDFKRRSAPTTLNIGGTSQLESRARGLHATQVFTFKSHIAAQWQNLESFKEPLKGAAEHINSKITCEPATMLLAVSDARGIRQATVKINGVAQTVSSDTLHPAYERGVHVELPGKMDFSAPLDIQIDLELLGTERISIVPLGGATQINLTSNWPHPSFDGQFLPSERKITDKGFEASWRVSSLASSAQQDVLKQRRLCGSGEAISSESSSASAAAVAAVVASARAAGDEAQSLQETSSRGCVETLGVAFIDPINTYSLSNRATKYGLLFIALTFVAVGLFEFMKSLRVHPIQYFLVGAAISIFFLLLVSLSEHLAFAAAYAIASSACATLLAYYASHMLGSWKRGLPFGLGIATLYGLLYVLLQLEQTALVVGAIALFIVLASVMALTRKVDWYAKLKNGGASVPQAQQ
jgi:inner membrane protein